MKIQEAYKYCPRCKSDFELKEEMLFCTNCGLRHYLNPKPCTNLIIENPMGEVLLVKRGVEPKKGTWDIPGGFVVLQETFEDAIIREIEEELSIKLSKEKLEYVGSYIDLYDYNGITYDILVVVFAVRIKAMVLKVLDDIEEYKWFAKKLIPLEEISFDSAKQSIKDYLKENGQS
jgi:ADP-ribose pyrophosphatase YjhB (NUDIX family)